MGFLDLFKKKNRDEPSDVEKLLSDFEKQDQLFEKHRKNNQKGSELEKQGQIEKAKEIYWENINENDESPHPYSRLAILYRKEKEYEKEIEVLEKAIYVYKNHVHKDRVDRIKKLDGFKERLNKVKEISEKSKQDA